MITKSLYHLENVFIPSHVFSFMLNWSLDYFDNYAQFLSTYCGESDSTVSTNQFQLSQSFMEILWFPIESCGQESESIDKFDQWSTVFRKENDVLIILSRL